MAADDREPRNPFPLVLAAVCALLGAALFTTSTVPAIREQERLEAIEAARGQLLDQLRQQNGELRATVLGVDRDPQAVLVEIDRLGLTPDELLGEAAPADAGR